MATIKDIARAAGVSHSTVSNVLNKKGNVSYAKIQLVEQTAKAMGYRIDENARLLRKGSTSTITVILPDIESARYADLYAGVLRAAEEHGYLPRLYLTENKPYLEKEAVASTIASRACAVVSVSCLKNIEKNYGPVQRAGIPVLFLERAPDSGNFCTILFDVPAAVKSIVGFIGRGGWKKIGVFTESLNFSCERQFRQELAGQGGVPEECFFENLHGELTSAFYLPFLKENAPDLFIASNEQLADCISNAAAFLGEKAPPVVALSTLRARRNCRYHQVALNYQQAGEQAAEQVHAFLRQAKPLQSRVLPVSQLRGGPVHIVPPRGKVLRLLSLKTPSSEALRCLSPLFTKQTGIRVEIETYPQSTIFEEILSEEKQPRDIIRIDASGLPYWAPRLFLPLEEIDPDINDAFRGFFPNLRKDFAEIGGVLYAVPFDISVQMLFYRKDLMEDPGQIRAFYEKTKTHLDIPKTYDEYNAVCRFFCRNTREDSPTVYGGSVALGNPSSAASEFLPRLLASGNYSYSAKGRLQFAGPQATRALQNYIQLAEYASPKTMHSWQEITDGFINGSTATAILFINHASRVVQAQRPAIAGAVGVAPIPGGRPLLGGGSLGVNRLSRQPELACQFIRWATSEQIAPELMIMGGISPCKQAYEQVQILNNYPWLKKLPENIALAGRKNVLFKPETALNLHTIEVQIGQLVIDAVLGRHSAEEAVWRAQFLLDEAPAI
ncbi:MAG: extracellular solute-binding protein [Oscillospiraceae bacterium]